MSAVLVFSLLWVLSLCGVTILGWASLAKLTASRRELMPKLIRGAWALAILFGLIVCFLPGGTVRWQALTTADAAAMIALWICIGGLLWDSRVAPILAIVVVARFAEIVSIPLESAEQPISFIYRSFGAWAAGFTYALFAGCLVFAAGMALYLRAMGESVRKSEVLVGISSLIALAFLLVTAAEPKLLAHLSWLAAGVAFVLISFLQIRQWTRVESREVRVAAGLFGETAEKISWGELVSRIAFVALATLGIWIATRWSERGGLWLGSFATGAVVLGWVYLSRAGAWREAAQPGLARLEMLFSGVCCVLLPLALLALGLELLFLDRAFGIFWSGSYRHLSALASVALVCLAFGHRFALDSDRSRSHWTMILLWLAVVLSLYRLCGPDILLGVGGSV